MLFDLSVPVIIKPTCWKRDQDVQIRSVYTVWILLSISPVIMRKLGPPLLAGQSTSCGEHLSSVVLSFTHNALSDIDCITKQPVSQLFRELHWSDTSHVSLTLLFIEVTVNVSLHLCIAPITHPLQMFTGDGWTCLIVERSGVEEYTKQWKFTKQYTKLSLMNVF